MRSAVSLVVFASLVFGGACASNKNPPPDNGASMSLSAPARVVARFSGRFSPVSNLTSGTMSTGSTRIAGTVRLLSPSSTSDRYLVELEFTSERGAEELLWSVVAGRCGNGSLPLAPPKSLAPIEVPTSGSVRVTRDLQAGLTAGLEYHLNLYANGSVELSGVIGCANLKS